jgi:hypothetical protein
MYTAHYLSNNGAATGDIEKNMYNRSDEYVKDVMYFYKKYEEQSTKAQENS